MKYFFAFLAIAGAALASGLPELTSRPFIYVTGTAKVLAPADAVRVRFTIANRDKVQNRAFDAVASMSQGVEAILKSLQIDLVDVDALDVTISRRYDYKSRNEKLLGYTVSREFSVTLRDVMKLSDLLEALQGIGLEDLSSPYPVSFRQSEFTTSAFKKALVDARKRAEHLASASGLVIAGVHAISEAPIPDISRRFFDSDDQIVTLSAFSVMSGEESFSIPPIKLTSSVHVVYLVEPMNGPNNPVQETPAKAAAPDL